MRAAVYIAAVLAAAACSSSSENKKAEEAPKEGGASLTDPQIAAIVVAANEADIAAGKQAEEKATAPAVKEFAQTMIRDHTAVNQQAVDLVTKLGVTPEPSETSRAITQNAEATRNRLAGMSGAEYDKAYVDNEVEYHQFVISAIEGQLIPSATNPELKALLEQVLPAFKAHLEHAQHLQAELAGGGATGAMR